MSRALRTVILLAALPAVAAAQNPADVRFMQGMIGHHAQALEMAALLRTRTSSPKMRLLGERIEVSQRDEIGMMNGWLSRHHQPIPDTSMAHHEHMGMSHSMMPGMLSPSQMDSLAAAKGTAFDRLFLRYMIQHHEGALVMVKELLGTSGAAQDSEVFRFASDVDADQRAEIARMRAMLPRSARTPAPTPTHHHHGQ